MHNKRQRTRKDMNGLEAALADIEAKIVEAQKSADTLTKAIKQLRQAAQLGHIQNLEKGLQSIAQRGKEAEAAARSLEGAWTFDTANHLASDYAEELRDEAASKGIRFFERDGRLYAFPLLLTVEPREAAVRVGKRRERRIRPKQLVELIAKIQKRPQRFREEKFLALLYEIYSQMAGAEWRKLHEGQGPAVSLAQMHDIMTLLPGTDYPVEEFARDLLLLDRRPDLRTRDGASFEFPGATLSKGGMKRIVVYDENGLERLYIAIRFVKGK
jgi:hypothetical protein